VDRDFHLTTLQHLDMALVLPSCPLKESDDTTKVSYLTVCAHGWAGNRQTSCANF